MDKLADVIATNYPWLILAAFAVIVIFLTFLAVISIFLVRAVLKGESVNILGIFRIGPTKDDPVNITAALNRIEKKVSEIGFSEASEPKKLRTIEDWYLHVKNSLDKAQDCVYETAFHERTWEIEPAYATDFSKVREQAVSNSRVEYHYIATFYPELQGPKHKTRLDVVEQFLDTYGKEKRYYAYHMPRWSQIPKSNSPMLNFTIIDDEAIVGFYRPSGEPSRKDQALVLKGKRTVDLLKDYFGYIQEYADPLNLGSGADTQKIAKIRKDMS